MNILKGRTEQFLLAVVVAFVAVGCSTGSKGKKEIGPEEKATLLVRAADAAIREGDPTGALEYLNSAEELNPNSPELYHARAIALYLKHDLKGSLKAANRAIELKPNYSSAQATLGKLYMDYGKYEEAIPHLKKASKDHLFRSAFKARTNLGIIFYRQKRYEDARTQFDLATRDQPQSACLAYYYRGNIHLKNARFRKALKDYKSATRQYCGNFADAHYAVGIVYKRSNRIDEARKKFIEVRKLFPDSPFAKKALAQIRGLP